MHIYFLYARDSKNIMDKKRNKLLVKVPDNVSKKYLDKMRENEFILCYFTYLRFQVVRRSIFSCVSCFLLESKQMRFTNFCDKTQNFKDVNLAQVCQYRHVQHCQQVVCLAQSEAQSVNLSLRSTTLKGFETLLFV